MEFGILSCFFFFSFFRFASSQELSGFPCLRPVVLSSTNLLRPQSPKPSELEREKKKTKHIRKRAAKRAKTEEEKKYTPQKKKKWQSPPVPVHVHGDGAHLQLPMIRAVHDDRFPRVLRYFIDYRT